MPPVIIEGNINIRVVWELPGGKEALNLLHADVGGAAVVNITMANTISGHVAAAHASSGLNAIQPDSVSIARVEIRDLRTANQPLISSTTGLPSAGTIVGGDMLPKQTALVITHRTTLAGDSFRGRSYVPGLDESASMAAGEASQAARDACEAFFDDLRVAMAGESWPLTVGSATLGIGTQITQSLSRVASFAVQRSRRTAF